MTLLPDNWSALIDAIRSGAVRRLKCSCVDFSALRKDAFLLAVGCRGLRSLDIQRSVVLSGFITDKLIRASAANGVLELTFCKNKTDAPQTFSEEAVMDFFGSVDAAAPGEAPLCLTLPGSGVTDMFLSRFFEVCTFVAVFFSFSPC